MEAAKQKVQESKTMESETPLDESKKPTLSKDEEASAVKYGEVVGNDTIGEAVKSNALSLITGIVSTALADAANRKIYQRDYFMVDPNIFSNQSYKFDNLSVFEIKDVIPRFLRMELLTNANQNPNVKNSSFLPGYDNINMIKDSVAIFNNSTMTVRFVFDKAAFSSEIDPNVGQQGIVQVESVESEYISHQTWVNILVNRVLIMAQLLRNCSEKLYSIPSKQTVHQLGGSTPLHVALSNTSFWVGDYPHPYLSIFGPEIPDWFVTQMNTIFLQHRMLLGEENPISIGGKKVSSTIRCAADQYATAIANINFRVFQDRQETTDRYELQTRANMFPRDNIRTLSVKNTRDLSLNYSPTQMEWNLLRDLIMVNASTRDKIFNTYREILGSTNRLNLLEINDVWRLSSTAIEQVGVAFSNKFMDNINFSTMMKPTDVITLETFAYCFDIDIDFGTITTGTTLLVEIYAILINAILFPRITQQTIHQVGYRLFSTLQAYSPDAMLRWINTFGTVIQNGQQINVSGRAITRNQSQSGMIYSIFADVQNQHNAVPPAFFAIIGRIRNIFLNNLHETVLDRKRIAQFPYSSDGYVAYQSWTQIAPDELLDIPQTELSIKIQTAMSVIKDLINFESNGERNANSLPRQASHFIKAFLDNISSLARSAVLPFQIDAYESQDFLMNSFGFVDDRCDPTRPFNVPYNLVLGSNQNTSDSYVPIQLSHISKFNIYTGLRFLLTLDGTYKRGIRMSMPTNPSDDQKQMQPQQEYLFIKGHILTDLAVKLTSEAKNFGRAFHFIQMIMGNAGADNPLQEVSDQIKAYLRMSNWYPLGREIFNVFGFDFKQFFLDAWNVNSGAFDGRNLDRTIRRIDPVTSVPFRNEPANSMFGKVIEFIQPEDVQKLRILARLFIHEDSPLLKYALGAYIGRQYVTEMVPQILDVEESWQVIPRENWRLAPQADKGGQIQTLIVTGADNIERVYKLPFDKTMPKIMITMQTLSHIPIAFKANIAKCITDGNLCLKVTRLRVAYHIIDQGSKVIDCSEELTASQIKDIISTPDGGVLPHTIVTTKYSTHFTSNATIIPTYRQYVSLFNTPDRDLFLAVINEGVQSAESVLPNPLSLEYGVNRGGISLAFSDNTEKIESSLININNVYSAVGKDILTNRIELDYIPAQPPKLTDLN